MNLHNDREAFHDLSALAAENIGIPITAVKRDYYIVMMLQKLAGSEYAGIRSRYETLHEDLLYTNEKQEFGRAIDAFRKISQLFAEIGE